jgi:acyl-lipid omega-6 desaturase (Delta-12 desaturase)
VRLGPPTAGQAVSSRRSGLSCRIESRGQIELHDTVTPGEEDDEARSAREWQQALRPYTEPSFSRSLLDLATSVVPYLALLTAIYFAIGFSTVLAVVLAIPAAGFLIRTFIVFHDCAHGSFLRSKRGNTMLGTATGILVWLPFQAWRREHAIHHATAGDLDRRGVGDVLTLTVAEYDALSFWRRLGYRLFRSPVVMFGLGWILVIVVKPRFVPKGASSRIRASVIGTDIALALIVAGFCLTIGWRDYLLLQAPTLIITGSVGIWLFYVQHQFEDTYWQSSDDWGYAEAALQGSSYLQLPRILQFFTGNIGFHHVHHLSAQIPNYNLQSAHEHSAQLQETPSLSLRDAMGATRLKLWDEKQNRLVSFREAKRSSQTPRASSQPAQT